MKTFSQCRRGAILLLALAPSLTAQNQAPTFEQAAASIQAELQASLASFSSLQAEIAREKIPLGKRLNELEAELVRVRLEAAEATRRLQGRALNLGNLQSRIDSRQSEVEYLSGLLAEYVRNFDASLHIAEVARYQEAVNSALLAPENSNLSTFEVFQAQAGLLQLSLDRLFEAMGGTRFDGTAVRADGTLLPGTFLLMGPAALFRSEDGLDVGTSDSRLGSLEPAVFGFSDEANRQAASLLVESGRGAFPLDPTLGDAHLTAAAEITLLEEVQKGGAVMWPILLMAAAALLVTLIKWVHLMFFPKASKRSVRALLDCVERGDGETAQQKAHSIRGPSGRMLRAGVANLGRPTELIEEVMYEEILTTRLRAQRFLPFIAICAASAPLLGLLGTVTGIINTFKLITIYGSGDVKTLSGGISEALITTKYGLVVAIPSMLLHAFLWRKARGVTGRMESVAMAFINQVAKTPMVKAQAQQALVDGVMKGGGVDVELVRGQVSQVLGEILSSPQGSENGARAY